MFSYFLYVNLMEKVLETLVKVCIDSKFTEIDMSSYLNHIINEVPIPPNDKKLIFYLPHMTTEVELQPLLLNDRRLQNFNIVTIFDLLSVENILLVFNLILMEQKILFVHDNRQKLTEVIECFLSLIHPFKWGHTNITILPSELIKFLESFMPFIMGMEESVYNSRKNLFEDESQIIFILNIRKNNLYMVEKKKPTKISKLTNIPKLPDEIYTTMLSEIKDNKSLLDQSKKQTLTQTDLINLDKDLRDIFIKSIVRSIGDYEKYLNYIDEIPIFSQDTFLKTRANENQDFFLNLTDTRMFYDFIQNIPTKTFPLFKKFCLRYINDICTNSMLKRKESKKLNSPVKKRSSNSNSNIFESFPALIGMSSSKESSGNLASIPSSDVTKFKNNEDEDRKEYKEAFMIKPFFIKEEELNIINYSDYLNGKFSTSSI